MYPSTAILNQRLQQRPYQIIYVILVRYCPIWKLIVSLSILLRVCFFFLRTKKTRPKYLAATQWWVTRSLTCIVPVPGTQSDRPPSASRGGRGHTGTQGETQSENTTFQCELENSEIYFLLFRLAFILVPERPKILLMRVFSLNYNLIFQKSSH